ncbi:MAG: hypothetical protein HC932_02280 [Thermales bacterium]|nr:hypothetical protein [Thermales bacterium]
MSKIYYIEGNQYDFSNQSVIASGGEGDIYEFGNYCVKVFHTSKTNKITKVTNMVTLTSSINWKQVGVSFPLNLVLDNQNQVVGYIQDYYQSTKSLLDYTVIKGSQAEILNAIELLKNLYSKVKFLHNLDITIVDWNYQNFLVTNNQVILIDADAWGFDNFLADAKTTDYLPPEYFESKRNNQAFQYNYQSDWYGFVTLVFEVLFGCSPHSTQTYKTNRTSYLNHSNKEPNKLRRMAMYPQSLLDYFVDVFENDLRGEFPIHLLDEAEKFTSSQQKKTKQVKVVSTPSKVAIPNWSTKNLVPIHNKNQIPVFYPTKIADPKYIQRIKNYVQKMESLNRFTRFFDERKTKQLLDSLLVSEEDYGRIV